MLAGPNQGDRVVEASDENNEDDDTDSGDDGTVPAIIVHGNLNIDSVKITSWDPTINDYVKFEYDILPGRELEHSGIDEVPRPYIRVEDDATGTTNITNSELAYLGYEDPNDTHGRSGLLYYGGDGSVVKGNHMHHNRFGFYSSGVGNIVLEDNLVHDSFMYGFDPHTGTHDMTIRNNTVHNSGAMGIICSLDCYNVMIENNDVSNSAGSGIMFSRNMTNSIARNNYVLNEEQCIFVSQSYENKVYNNTVNDCGNGIYLKSESSNNSVFNNPIQDVNGSAILINDGASDNAVYSNTIVNPSSEEGAISNEDQGNNMIKDNNVVQSPSNT